MHILKKVLIGLCVSLLTVALFGFGLTWSIQQVVGGPNHIKMALRESGLYQSGITDALDQVQKNQKEQGEKNEVNIPLNNPDVRQLIADAFPASFVQDQTEGALDSVFAWLNGKSPALAFTVDLSQAKQRLADSLGAYVQQHLSTLPACPASTTPPTDDFDPFNATCVPRGARIADVSSKARDQILKGDFLKDAKIDASTIKTDNGKTIDQQLQPAKTAYQCVKWCALDSAIVTAILAVAIILLSVTWRSGVRKVAIVLISMGVMSALLGGLGKVILHRALQELVRTTAAQQPLQQKGIHVGEALLSGLLQTWFLYGVVLMVIGIAALLIVHFTTPKANEQATVLAHTPEPLERTPKPERKGIKPTLPEIKT